MNIMAQVPLEKKINMSYSAEELLVTCFFDGVSCDARSGKEAALLALRTSDSEPLAPTLHLQLDYGAWE